MKGSTIFDEIISKRYHNSLNHIDEAGSTRISRGAVAKKMLTLRHFTHVPYESIHDNNYDPQIRSKKSIQSHKMNVHSEHGSDVLNIIERSE